MASPLFLSPSDLEEAIDSVIRAVAPFNQGPVQTEEEVAACIHIGTPFWRRVRNARAKSEVVHRACSEATRRGLVVRHALRDPGMLGLSEAGWERWRRIHGVRR